MKILVNFCRDHKICGSMVVEIQRYKDPQTCGCRYSEGQNRSNVL